MVEVAAETRRAFAAYAVGDLAALEAADIGLGGRTLGLVRIAALIALDAPPSSYGRWVADAIAAGASADDILGVLRAVAPQVGAAKVIAAAPEIMLALGLSLPEQPQ